MRRRYHQQGLAAALHEKPRSGQPRKITPAVEATITSLACTDAPDGASRWSIRLLRGRLIELGIAIGEESARQVLKKSQLNPCLKKQWCLRQLDGEYLAKREDALQLYQQPAEAGRARLCFDERTCQLLGDKLAALPARPKQVAKQDHEYVRHDTAVVLLTYDLDTSQRYAQVRTRRTKADFAEFLHQLLNTHYADVPQVELVQDNLNTHALQLVLRAPADGTGAGAKPAGALSLHAQARLVA